MHFKGFAVSAEQLNEKVSQQTSIQNAVILQNKLLHRFPSFILFLITWMDISRIMREKKKKYSKIEKNVCPEIRSCF